ncbi:MAG: metallophosphoesterase [Cyclobacteriaceae bacterium]
MLKIQYLLPILIVICRLSEVSAQSDTIYLAGDAGEYTYLTEGLITLKDDLGVGSPNAMIIFLGDNVYKKGTIFSENWAAKLGTQLEVVERFNGNVAFVPGNHDWQNNRWKGKESILHQGAYLDSALANSERSIAGLFPKRAFPGPEHYDMQNTRVIFIDSQWWFQQIFRPVGRDRGKGKMKEKFLLDLSTLLDEAHELDLKVLIAAHHPLFSIGHHGAPKQPQRFISNFVLFPLHILGLDRLFRQDIAQPSYRRFRKKIFKVFSESKLDASNLIWAAGHEHHLQYSRSQSMGFHHVVSGSGSKLSDYHMDLMQKSWNRDAQFVYPLEQKPLDPKLGFIKVIITKDEINILIN